MKKISTTIVEVIKQDHGVRLVKLSRRDCAKENYGVSAPQKIGYDVNGNPQYGADVCDQFHTQAEAENWFQRMVDFWSKRS
jgi:hypothetical protein